MLEFLAALLACLISIAYTEWRIRRERDAVRRQRFNAVCDPTAEAAIDLLLRAACGDAPGPDNLQNDFRELTRAIARTIRHAQTESLVGQDAVAQWLQHAEHYRQARLANDPTSAQTALLSLCACLKLSPSS